MAIYHLTTKTVSRGKGQSATAKAAYNSRDKLENEHTGEAHDYRRAGGVLFSGVFAPKNAPEWAHDRAALWNEVERFEKRKDAQLAREVEVSLPHELTDEQRLWLVKDFVREQFVRKGMVADVNIHAPGKEADNRNHHAHILLTMREIGPDGFGLKVREWNSKEQLQEWREAWERHANRALERHGHAERISSKSLEAQGIEREPTRHRGPHVDAMERKGIETERGAECRAIETRNTQRHAEGRTMTSKPADEIHAGRAVGAALTVTAKAAEKTIEAVADVLEGLLGGTTTPKPKPRPREEVEAEAVDWERSLKDKQYRQELFDRETEAREQRQREQDEYQKRSRERS